MTFLGTQEQEGRQAQQLAALGPLTEQYGGPAPLEGLGTATLTGIGRGITSIVAGASVLEQASFTSSAPFRQPLAELLGVGESYRAAELKFNQTLNNAMEATRIDPNTTGFAGQLTYGIGGVLVPAAAGTIAGGPLLGAAAGGFGAGSGTYFDLRAEGVDEQTAASAAAIEGGIAALSFGLPAGLGARALTRVGTGAALNVGAGMGERYAMGRYLESQGYAEMAKRYEAMDGLAIATDAILGGAFGAIPGRRPAQIEVDAALTNNAARQAEVDLAPGLPTDALAAAANIRAQDLATQQLLSGERVTASTDGFAYVARPVDPAFSDDALTRAFRESGYPELLDEVAGLELELAARGRSLADEPLPGIPERRADVNELARLGDLRQRRKSLTGAEKDELLTLEDRDRKAAKVAGRRIPGVLNMEARIEAEAAGELLPVQAFADADNFKLVNDELGHEVGDRVIGQIGQLFAEVLGEGNVFHRGGDEFVMQARTSEELAAAMTQVRAQLEQAELVATRADGTTVSRRGVRFSYGEGKTVQEAEHAQYADKAARKAAGLRTDRDTKPASDDRRTGEGVDDAGIPNRSGRVEAAPVTDQVAEQIATENPSLDTPDGPARDALKAADDAIFEAERDAPGFEAAIACFLRRGA